MPIKAILFDAYGTLLDIHSSVGRHANKLGPQAQAISQLWRQKQLEYTWTLTLAGRYRPFNELTEAALDFALAQHGHADAQLRKDLLDSYAVLDPFADVRPALEKLKAAGITCGILSNGTPAMLQTALQAAGIAGLLDPVLSVDDLRIYKPDPRVYAMAAQYLALASEEIGFVSSNAWDAMGASSFGFQVFKMRRREEPEEYGLSSRTTPLASLADLVQRL